MILFEDEYEKTHYMKKKITMFTFASSVPQKLMSHLNVVTFDLVALKSSANVFS